MNAIFKKITALCVMIPSMSYASLSLDRTRIIFDGKDNSVSLRVYNSSERLPFLAQSWFENNKGEHIEGPFVATPPIQRIEPKQQSQIKIEKLSTVELPQDRESVYYFNFRQIPPKSDKPNVLQLTIQTKIKLFYRPTNLFMDGTEISNQPWQKKLVLKKNGQKVIAVNPTPYYITISAISPIKGQASFEGFEAFMVAPFSELDLSFQANQMGNQPFITYIDDYGSKKLMSFKCMSSKCEISSE
jgi:chaperone protein PapD